MIQPDRLTVKAAEALQQAASLARSKGNPVVNDAHLFYALLQQEEGIAYSPADDQYRQDLFYRYNQNFQDFFDASARVKTTFA